MLASPAWALSTESPQDQYRPDEPDRHRWDPTATPLRRFANGPSLSDGLEPLASATAGPDDRRAAYVATGGTEQTPGAYAT